MNSGQHGGTNDTCRRKTNPHDTVVDRIVSCTELVCTETGENTHKSAKTNTDEHNADSEEQNRTGITADVQDSKADQCDEQGKRQRI